MKNTYIIYRISKNEYLIQTSNHIQIAYDVYVVESPNHFKRFSSYFIEDIPTTLNITKQISKGYTKDLYTELLKDADL